MRFEQSKKGGYVSLFLLVPFFLLQIVGWCDFKDRRRRVRAAISNRLQRICCHSTSRKFYIAVNLAQRLRRCRIWKKNRIIL